MGELRLKLLVFFGAALLGHESRAGFSTDEKWMITVC